MARERPQCDWHCSTPSQFPAIDWVVHIKLVASAALLGFGKGHRQVFGIDAELSVFTVTSVIWQRGWFNISQKQLVQDKDGSQCRRSGFIMVDVSCRAHPQWQLKGKQGVCACMCACHILLVYHTGIQKTEQRWQDVVSRCHVLPQYVAWQRAEFNFLSATCMSTTSDARSQKKQKGGERYARRWNGNTPVAYSEHVNSSAVGKKNPCHTLPLMIYSLICHTDASSILSVLLAS